MDWYDDLSPGLRRALVWLLAVPGAEEPTWSQAEEAARALVGSDRREVLEIALCRLYPTTSTRWPSLPAWPGDS